MVRTGVLRSEEKAVPRDLTVGLYLGPFGGPRGGRRFLMSGVPLYHLGRCHVWGCCPMTMGEERIRTAVQGYLTLKKTHPPRTLP